MVICCLQGSVTGNRDSFGRVSYEQNGECFFIPFTQDSVVDSSVKLRTGDQVMFRLSANSVLVVLLLRLNFFFSVSLQFIVLINAAWCLCCNVYISII